MTSGQGGPSPVARTARRRAGTRRRALTCTASSTPATRRRRRRRRATGRRRRWSGRPPCAPASARSWPSLLARSVSSIVTFADLDSLVDRGAGRRPSDPTVTEDLIRSALVIGARHRPDLPRPSGALRVVRLEGPQLGADRAVGPRRARRRRGLFGLRPSARRADRLPHVAGLVFELLLDARRASCCWRSSRPTSGTATAAGSGRPARAETASGRGCAARGTQRPVVRASRLVTAATESTNSSSERDRDPAGGDHREQRQQGEHDAGGQARSSAPRAGGAAGTRRTARGASPMRQVGDQREEHEPARPRRGERRRRRARRARPCPSQPYQSQRCVQQQQRGEDAHRDHGDPDGRGHRPACSRRRPAAGSWAGSARHQPGRRRARKRRRASGAGESRAR